MAWQKIIFSILNCTKTLLMWRDPKQYKCSGPWFKFNNDLFKVHCVRFCCLLYYHGLLRGLIYASTPLCAFSFKQHFHFQPNYGSEIKIDGNAENFTLMPERNALKHRVRSNLQNYRILSCIHFLVTVFRKTLGIYFLQSYIGYVLQSYF